MSRTKDYFAPVEQPDNMPQEQDQDQDQGQQVFAHMIYQLINNNKTELALD
jgi:Ulp1 family protease